MIALPFIITHFLLIFMCIHDWSVRNVVIVNIHTKKRFNLNYCGIYTSTIILVIYFDKHHGLCTNNTKTNITRAINFFVMNHDRM